VSRVPPTTSESGKNALGQEAFGTKAPEVPVVEYGRFDKYGRWSWDDGIA
jgi:hypothetical protein